MIVKILQGSLIICLPIIIILSNLLLLINSTSYHKTLYKKENIYQNFQSKIEVDNATKELIGFFRGQNNLEDNLYSQQAKFHLKDVKSLVQSTSVINFLSIIVVAITALSLLKRKKYRLFKRAIIIGCSVTISIIFITAISVVVNFNFIFIKFHKLLFNNNLWLFPKEDNLIKLFPISFFVEFTKQLLIDIFASVFLLLCLVHLLPKDDSKTN